MGDWGLDAPAGAREVDPLDDDALDASWSAGEGLSFAGTSDARWTATEADAESLVALPELAATDEGFADDAEGPRDAAIELSVDPPSSGGDDESTDPLDDRADVLSGEPAAFALRPPPACAFVVISERDADAFARARADVLETDDGSPRGPARSRVVRASVRFGDLLAFAFARGPGQRSVDGGERFDTALWLQGAIALAAAGDALFAAVYDAPVDRCTIVRARGATVERVADLHELLGPDDASSGDDVRCAVTALVALHPDGTRLLVRTSRRSIVLSIPR